VKISTIVLRNKNDIAPPPINNIRCIGIMRLYGENMALPRETCFFESCSRLDRYENRWLIKKVAAPINIAANDMDNPPSLLDAPMNKAYTK